MAYHPYQHDKEGAAAPDGMTSSLRNIVPSRSDQSQQSNLFSLHAIGLYRWRFFFLYVECLACFCYSISVGRWWFRKNKRPFFPLPCLFIFIYSLSFSFAIGNMSTSIYSNSFSFAVTLPSQSDYVISSMAVIGRLVFSHFLIPFAIFSNHGIFIPSFDYKFSCLFILFTFH